MNEEDKYYQKHKKSDPIMDSYYELQALKVKEVVKKKELSRAEEIREYLRQQEEKSKKFP